jgi:multidrug efflux pump subunit AcrB
VKLVEWFLRQPVAANLLMVFIVAAGLLTLSQLRSEAFPRLPANSISISVPFVGHSAQQVNNGITEKIEQALEGTEGIKHIFSVSYDSTALIQVIRTDNYNLDQLLVDIKSKVDSIEHWPKGADRPVIERDTFSYPSLIVQVYGGKDEVTRQRVAKQVKQALLAEPDISKIKTWGLQQPQIRLEATPEKLSAHKVTLIDVAQAISNNSLTTKSGLLKTASGNLLINADHQAYWLREFQQIVVKSFDDGRQVTLADVVEVHDAFAETEEEVRFQGEMAIGMSIQAGQRSDLLEISKQAQQVLKRLKPTLPSDIKLEVWSDLSLYIEKRLSLLSNNALQGILIVFTLLAIFLNVRLAFWVALGVPIAISGTFIFMGERFLDYTFNELTTFGFILVLGILVDDAIIVGESVSSTQQRISNRVDATLAGVKRIAAPTVYGVLTTIAAFFPMTQLPNEMGKLFASFSWIVIIALMCSLLESKLILPTHLAHGRQHPQRSANRGGRFYRTIKLGFERLQQLAATGLSTFTMRIYKPGLQKALHYRYAILSCFLALAIVMLGQLYHGHIRTIFFPEIPGDLITIELTMEENSPLALTKLNRDKLSRSADKLNQAFRERYHTEIDAISKLMIAMDEDGVELYAELPARDQRAFTTQEVVEYWRASVGTLEGSWNLSFSSSDSGAIPAAEIVIQHPDEWVLQQVRDSITSALKQQDGMKQITDNLNASLPELSFSLKPEAYHLGFTSADLATQLAANLGGLEAQRIQRAEHEVKVMLQLDRRSRNARTDLEQLTIQNQAGISYPLLQIADVTQRMTTSQLRRRDGSRSASILALVDKSKTSPEAVFTALKQAGVFRELQQQYPALVVKAAGELEQSAQSKKGLTKAFILSLLAIYALLAVPLRSYVQPLVIMSVIPFGMVGAILGHVWLNVPVSFLSFLGVLALSGVVVNDSLVMISRYNDLKTQSGNKRQAIIDACCSRLRAIFLTTVTTFAGLTPLLSETSEQAQYLIPAAISLAYGELFATIITLILVPVLLAIGDDIRQWFTNRSSASTTLPHQTLVNVRLHHS